MSAVDSPEPAENASDAPNGGHAAPAYPDVLGLLLAGGQGSRMGGRPKGLLEIGSQSMLRRVRDRFGAIQTLLSVPVTGAGWLPHADAAGLEVLRDDVAEAGPLAALAAVAQAPALDGKRLVLTLPWDCPFLPADLAPRMMAAAEVLGTSVIAADEKRAHPAIALWRRSDLLAIADAFRMGERRLSAAAKFVNAVKVQMGVSGDFMNINTPDDLALARAKAAG